MTRQLTTIDHSRNVVGLKYVYPVISRRAGGLSIGINVNTNNACNWRCVYCQVPELVRGTAPEMNFQLLEEEFKFFLDQVLNGDFYDQFNVPEQNRVIKDIAISGNGEPTSIKNFDRVIALIGKIATQKKVFPESDFILITNGSLMHQKGVQNGLRALNRYRGQVWFKLDSATEQGRKKINNAQLSNKKVLENLQLSTTLCETSIQMCMINYLSIEESKNENKAYLQLLERFKKNQIKIAKIMMYSIARPSLQAEAIQLEKVAKRDMQSFASKIIDLGYVVDVSY